MREDSRTLKTTPAGKVYMHLMAHLNSGDPQYLRKFVLERFTEDALKEYTIEGLVEWLWDIYDDTGGLRIHKVFLSQEYYIVIVAMAINGGALFLDKLKVTDTEPYQVIEFYHEVHPDG